MVRRRWSAASIEPLWIASLGLLIILPGYQFRAAVIRFFGRGGQTETVEWLVYVSVLVVFPIAAFVATRFIFPISSRTEWAVKAALVLFLSLEVLVYLARSQLIAIGSAL